MQVSLVYRGAAYPLEAVPPELLVEHESYRLRLEEERQDADPEAYQAEAGEVELPLVRERSDRGRVLLEWEWAPAFFTGEFAFVIRYRGERIYPPAGDARRLLVRPDQHKLTAGDFEAMLADLVQWTDGWLTPAPGQTRGAGGRDPAQSPLAQLELLLRHWETVEHQIAAVVERPRRRLAQQRVAVPFHLAQMVTGRQWQAALEQPGLWSPHPAIGAGPLARVQEGSAGLLPRRLPQESAYSTLAVPENLFVVTLIADLRDGLMRALTLLEGAAPGPQRAVAGRRREQAVRMLKRVTSWLRESWLSELDPVPGPFSPMPALLKHPVYGSLWRFYLRWRRAVALFDGDDRPLPLDRTYQLYEYWCFLVVARAVARFLGRDPEAVADGVMRRGGAGLYLALAPGKEVSLPFPADGVTVSYQRAFYYREGGGQLYSCSHRQVPDVTIEWAGPDGAPRLLLFDPKYRVGHDGVLAGLGDMHRYRDAIVTGEGRRAVAGGFLLCPGEPAEVADRWYLRSEYQDRWDFGICRLAPGGGEAELDRLLARYLRTPC